MPTHFILSDLIIIIQNVHKPERYVLGPLFNWRSGLSIRNVMLLCKQVIHPMLDYTCSVSRSAVHSHVMKLQVLQSKCLCIVTNVSWYVGNGKIHNDLGDPFSTDHIRSLRVSAQS
jgi:hypothetical protein